MSKTGFLQPTVHGLADLFVVNITSMRIQLERLGWGNIYDDGIPGRTRSRHRARPGEGQLLGR